MLNHNDLFEALIRVGNEPSDVFDIMKRLNLQQPEGIMLYREETLLNLRRTQMVLSVIIPFYEFTLCCPVHPPHDYDYDLDAGSRRHATWRNTQAHEKARTRHRERLIMGILNS